MEFHLGRLLDHVHVRVRDLEASKRFYAALLASVGAQLTLEGPGLFAYHPGYYAAYALDPDGNNLEAVFHGPARRSAPSVVVTPGP